MNIAQFLAFAETHGVTFREKDGGLLAHAEHAAGKAWIHRAKEEIARRKEAILSLLEHQKERAAIREFDGGEDRKTAEEEARKETFWRFAVRTAERSFTAHFSPWMTREEADDFYPDAIVMALPNEDDPYGAERGAA
ncbi:MAG: hypothetical protein LBD68_08325 [Zoogloeaceae bacterium]|jgi:hypothetical protein|nr:hypothetical protein [Zoogloeaceae bacterium]